MTRHIYDNTNLAESYAGTATPLTFSFARSVYEESYKQFCRMMGVSEKCIEEQGALFARLLVFIGYRMYYDLTNWYRLVALLPGYSFNKPFFERMLGVPAAYAEVGTGERSFGRALRELPRVVIQVSRIAGSFLFMGLLVRWFLRDFDRALAQARAVTLAELPLPTLAAEYRTLATRFVARWRVPIANDFAVMVSTGLAERLCRKWVGQDVYRFLTQDAHGSLVSLDPGRRLFALARAVAADSTLRELFAREGDGRALFTALAREHASHPVTHALFDYLRAWGDRVPSELKLESRTLTEEPERLVLLLSRLVQTLPAAGVPSAGERRTPALPRLPFTRAFALRLLIRWAQVSLARREETRARRALIFGHARKIFLAMGKRLAADGVIAHEREIFFLTLEEVFDAVAASPPRHPITATVAERAAAMERWSRVELPRRIETVQEIPELEATLLRESASRGGAHRGGVLRGVVAARPAAGRVEGTALVLREFDAAQDFQGKILVARQTDPGWAVIFPVLKGLVVERGGLLSHAAIAARELNLPCIVGVPRATDCVPTGRRVELDLEAGALHVRG